MRQFDESISSRDDTTFIDKASYVCALYEWYSMYGYVHVGRFEQINPLAVDSSCLP